MSEYLFEFTRREWQVFKAPFRLGEPGLRRFPITRFIKHDLSDENDPGNWQLAARRQLGEVVRATCGLTGIPSGFS